MLRDDYVSLRLQRLRNSQEFTIGQGSIVFILPTRGSGRCISARRSECFGPGDVIVLATSLDSRLVVEKDQEIILWSFSVQLEHLFPLFANDEVWLLQDLENRLKDIRAYRAESPVAAQCHRLAREASPQRNLEHRSHLLRLAAVVLSAELSDARPRTTGYVRLEDHLNSVFEKLSTDEILGMSVDELAARFNCSRRHLNRLFHQRFGLSVSTLRMELRLLKAASLLRDADAKIINVAEQCSFNHLGLFNTCFKRRFGMSPGEWRKQPIRQPTKVRDAQPGSADCRLRSSGLCPWCAEGETASRPAAAAAEELLTSVLAAPPIRASVADQGAAHQRLFSANLKSATPAPKRSLRDSV